jgi:hypothetical protein
LLAYVFWHWKRPNATTRDYEARQRGFHAALGASPSPGFIDSFSVGVSNAPWVASSEAYEDWYLVQDFGALGLLNEAAVSSSRAQPHDAAASVAAGGAGGLYGLRLGTALRWPRYAHWFSKPEGMPYRELFTQLAPVVDRLEGALWMRQMVLGPAREFCLHAAVPVPLPADLEAIVIPLRQTWPELPDKGMEPTR